MSRYQIFQVQLMLTGGIFFLILCILLALNENYYGKKKLAIVLVELSAALLLFSDTIGFLYNGQSGSLAWFFTRFCNFLSFFFSVFIGYTFFNYVVCVIFENTKKKDYPKRVNLIKKIIVLALFLVVIMSITGQYFYVDVNNVYHRGRLFILSFVMPIICIILIMTVIIQYRDRINKSTFISFVLFAVAPQLGAILQYFFYGGFFINMIIGVSSTVIYATYVVEQNRAMVKNVSFDVKTGIFNCYGFLQKVDDIIMDGYITQYDAYYFDLMRFGNLNSQYGQEMTDEIIRTYVRKLNDFFEKDDVLGRLGGNYFVALVKKTKRESFLNLMSGITFDIDIGNKVEKITISAVAGGYSIENDNVSSIQLLDFVSIALSLAKHSYKTPYLFFSDEIRKELFEIQNLEQKILGALENGEFVAYYQPKVNCKKMKLCGAEALVRWMRDGKMVPPSEFIPLMERNEMICKLDFYMLNYVCKDIANWMKEGYELPCISVNFSRRNLGNPELATQIYNVLKDNNIPTDKIEIEITETIDEYSITVLRKFVEELHDYGIKVAIDDFGVGSSSMNLLREVIFDVLKIDKTFIDNFSEKEVKILKHIVGIAKDTGAHVISEGVERREQCELLLELGCEEIQGYIFDKPLIHDEFEKRLATNYYMDKYAVAN